MRARARARAAIRAPRRQAPAGGTSPATWHVTRPATPTVQSFAPSPGGSGRARGGSSRALGHPPVASARAHGPPGQPAHRAERARKPGRVRLKGPRSTIGEGLRQAATVGAAEPGGVRPNGPRSTLIG